MDTITPVSINSRVGELLKGTFQKQAQSCPSCPASIRRQFYNRLADAAGVPRRRRIPQSGFPIPYGRGRRAAVRVYHYSGDSVQRIQATLDGPWGCPDFELTCRLDELSAWAPWVAGWIQAQAPDGLPTPPEPTRLARPWRDVADLQRADYLWTARANRVACGVGRCPMCGAVMPPPPGQQKVLPVGKPVQGGRPNGPGGCDSFFPQTHTPTTKGIRSMAET